MSCTVTFAQTDSFVTQLNKPYYTQGDKVYYKLILPTAYDGKPTVFNIRLYRNSTLLSQFYNRSTDGNSINGEIELAQDFESGDYQLAFFVADREQKITENVGLIDFKVYNDLSEEEPLTGGYQSNLDHNKVLSITAKFDSIVETRSLNDISLVVLNEEKEPIPAEFSVSILDKELVYGEQSPFISLSSYSDYSITNPSNNLFFEGVVTDDTNSPQELKIIAVWSIEGQDFSFTRSNAEGSFFFELDDFEGKQNIQFVRYDHSPENLNYKLVTPSLATADKNANIDIESIVNYLAESRTRRKLAQYFGYYKRDKLVTNSIITPEIPKANVYYKLSEYKRFQTIGNFIKELSTVLKIKIDDEGLYTARMTDPKTKSIGDFYLGETPIFIIDGVISRDANFAGSISFDDVVDIKLYYDLKDLRKMFNVMGRDGAVIVQTKLPNFSLDSEEQADIFRLNGLQSGTSILSHDPKTSTADSTSPMFSPSIYWNPKLTSDAEGKADFSFYHTDDIGQFVIMVLARTADGQVVSKLIEYNAESVE